MRTAFAPLLASIALAAGVALAPASPARACGGMLFPAHSERVGGMSQQELLVAFTPERTVLVASAGYKGATGAPAFILPLRAEPERVEQADLGVLAALDDLTAPEVHITVDDGDDDGGGLCGAAGGVKDGGNFMEDGDVMVLQRGSTGDYDYVLLAGDTGMAVDAWLADAGYALPPDYAAALQPYVDAGDFIFAAKLKTDRPDGALAPIELHLPAIDPGAFAIPFGLAAHSLPPGESLTITTYLIASGGLQPGNYPAAPIDRDALIAINAAETNYQEVYDAAVGVDGGAWVVDASRSEFSADAIRDAYDDAELAGRLPPDVDRDAVVEFTARVPFAGARLTRLRTTLGAAQLHDMTLQKVAGADVERDIHLVHRPHSSACAVGRRGLPAGALLLPLLLLLRRRR
jgi:hypothetical protein